VVLDEILPLTTWTCVPFLTTTVRELNTTIRISGSYDVEKNRTHDGMERLYRPFTRFGSFKGFQEADVDGPAMGWQVYGILERFQRVGTTHERTNKDEHKHIILKTLNINVQAPPDIDPAVLGCAKSCSRGTCGEQKEKIVLNPDFLANAIARHIRRDLKCRSTEARGSFTQCKIVFEHVEYITVTRNEYEKEAFDIAELMKEMYTFKQWATAVEDIYEYQSELLRMRRERDLRVGLDVCAGCDRFSCWYFCRGEVRENLPYGAEGGMKEEMGDDSSDDFEEENAVSGWSAS
jgi:hypothetical protein